MRRFSVPVRRTMSDDARMKFLKHPAVEFVGAIAQILLGLIFLRLLPGDHAPRTTFSIIMGSVFLILGLVRIVKMIRDRLQPKAVVTELNDADLYTVKQMIAKGEHVEAIAFARSKTGAGLKETAELIRFLGQQK